MAQYAAKPKKKGHPILITLTVLLVLALLALSAGFMVFKSEISGSLRTDARVTVTIPQGASAATVASVLEQEGIIGHRLVFRAYIKFVVKDSPAFQYGDFELNPAASYAQIIDTLTTVVTRQDTVTVTFPEGYNAFQMGEALEQAGLCTRDAFVEAANTHSYDVSFFGEIEANELKMVKLDGFLFPDTYQFFPEATVDEIILTMLQNFEKKALTADNKAKLADSGFTLEQWVIFSSILQKESANTEEMYNVSSVFHNRMQNGSSYPNLESCTTNNYIWDYIEPAFDGNPPQNLLDAYDTYGSPGLPVGAIANPGADALTAALNPNDTPYFFFVTDVEYTHYYGKTFAEHQQNIERAKAVNKTHGIDGLVTK